MQRTVGKHGACLTLTKELSVAYLRLKEFSRSFFGEAPNGVWGNNVVLPNRFC